MAKSRVLITALALALLANCLSSVSPARLAATPDEAKWSKVNIPTEGRIGNWVLAPGSDIQHLTIASDGTLYGYARPLATNYTLFKSADNGYTWSYTGGVTEAITAIATAPDDANIIYYATTANVYKSVDAGTTFFSLLPNPGGAGSNNVTITSLDVSRVSNGYITAVGTRDSDSLEFGGIYTFDENKPSSWLDTSIGNFDVVSLVFSPNYPTDYQLMAVVTNEQDTFIKARVDKGGWGEVFGDAIIPGLAARNATFAFPDDYNVNTPNTTFFVAIDAGGEKGNVFQVKQAWAPLISMAIDLDIGYDYHVKSIDISGLAVSGNTTTATLLAGAAASTQIYISTDGGEKWVESTKKPTGQSRTEILMTANLTANPRVYAATSGTDSALSYSKDGGITWNQIGLIDTRISNIVDLVVSPHYSEDSTLFMLTFDTSHSLWRSTNEGENWERVLTNTLADANTVDRLELSPLYGSGNQTVYLAGTSFGNPSIWQSPDSGQTFRRRGVPFPIDTWLVANDNTIFFGSYNGTTGLLYQTTSGGLSYFSETAVGSYPLKSIALSPDYEQDKTILIGDTRGSVCWSQNDGTFFELVGHELPKGLLPGDDSNLMVAFDPDYEHNKTIYAASDLISTNASKERIYRFIMDEDDAWDAIDSSLPIGSVLNDLKLTSNGILYAANFKSDSGIERSLNPTYSLGPKFETVTRGLENNAKLFKLRLSGNQLWSIDTQNTAVMTYLDTLALPITPTSPANQAQGVATGNISLDWKTLAGATKYHWQLDYDNDFSTVPPGFEGDTEESSARLPALNLATTYYWRVRATEPVLSLWSDKWSFTTSLGTSVIGPELYSPEAGVSGVPLQPVFQWSAIAGADSYELLVATDPSFSKPLVVKIGDYALPSTAWQSDIKLNYDTTYYWKARAKGSMSYSDWSSVGAFTTEIPPPQTPPPQPASPSPPIPSPPSPQAQADSTFPTWLLYLGFGILLTIVLLLITILLVLVVTVRRL